MNIMAHTLEVMMEQYMSRAKREAKLLFNRYVFSTYYGYIKDTEGYPATVKCFIPEIGGTLKCYLTYPFIGNKYVFQTPIEIGTRVVVLCTAFDLIQPLIINQIPNNLEMLSKAPADKNKIIIKNGTAGIYISENKIELKNGSALLEITNGNIRINGRSVTCNGEDLTWDDIGKE